MLGAHREDDRARLVDVVADADLVDAAGLVGELDAGGLVGDVARAEVLGLVAHLLHQLGAHDAAAGKPGVVLDLGRLLQQAAPEEALDDERLEVRARGVQRRRVAGRAAADDDHVLDSAVRCSWSLARFRVLLHFV